MLFRSQKAELNKIARELGLSEGKIRSVEFRRDGGTLIEVDSDNAARWFTNSINKAELCSRLGDSVSFCTRVYNVIVLNVPLTLEPDDPKHREEICESNNIEAQAVVAMRWAKPINRRSEYQRSAHLVVSYTDPEAANRAITFGIQICNKKCYVERMKKEPIRCLKCQGWNHLARDCSEARNTCSNCAGEHRTADCIQPRKTRCVSCSSNDHASWSRECPTFVKKKEEFDSRNPENALQYFPTAEPWTWTTDSTNSNAYLSTNRLKAPPTRRENGYNNSHQTKSKGKARACDTYIPGHDDWWDKMTIRNERSPIPRWGEDEPRTSQNTASGSGTHPDPEPVAPVASNNSGNTGPPNSISNERTN